MYSFILIAVLAALTVYNDAASIPNEVAPYQEDVVTLQENVEVYQKDYNLGATGRLLKDNELILFHKEYIHLPGIPYTVQHRDVVYFGNSTTDINRIMISNPPSLPGFIFSGNYRTYGHVRLTSAPGVGLLSTVSFFGTYTDRL